MTKSFWQEVLDSFDPEVVGTEVATRNRVAGAVRPVAATAIRCATPVAHPHVC